MTSTVPGPGETLFSFVRHWSRRGAESERERGRVVLVTEAVHTLESRDVPASINAIAHEIGVDQSGASRMVRVAIDGGYLGSTDGPGDRRSRPVTVTGAGRALLADAHRWQEQVFAELTAGWTARRRAEFHVAMTDLVARSRD